jgi:hypothetical protein
MVVQLLTFPTDPKLVPIGLAAAHRNEQIPPDHDFFGPLVGDWNVKSIVHKKDGTRSEWDGVWSFRWILNGSAIEDVLSAKEQNPDQLLLAAIGLRSYDPTNQTWRMINFEPFSNTIQELRVVRAGGKLVETVLGSDPVETWTFENITPASFYWVDRYAERTGIRVQQEILGTRIR